MHPQHLRMGNARSKLLIALLLTILCTRERAKAADTTLVFYMHDVVTGKGQTALPVILPNGAVTNTAFGAVTVIDDPLTEAADQSSKVLGRGQGVYISAAQTSANFFMAFTAVLTSPEYKQSTISFQGADRFQQAQRDISVVGGTGMFQFAQGSATIQTISLNGSNAVLKYTVSINSAAPSNSPSSSNSPSLNSPSSWSILRARNLGYLVLSVFSVIYLCR